MRAQIVIVLAIAVLFVPGCATVFSGYYTTVDLKNAPDSLRVYTAQGVEIPVIKRTVRVTSPLNEKNYENREVTQLELRSNQDPVLILKNGAQEKRVQVFGKIQAGWFALDVLFGLPWIVDAITGNWNTYEPIDAKMPQ